MTKQQRQKVLDKYGGRCAYCGIYLTKGWHVDHIHPAWHTLTNEDARKHQIKKGSNTIENYNPACPRCNRWKATFSLEELREQIAAQVQRLNSYSSNYRMALDYGLIIQTDKSVTFYFEAIEKVEH